ncbi:MAG: undecaprenyl-diphosphate phosphatase [Candidatus Bathyarchaeota archaeon]|nr:undecaprenyl-diphosphate phosphatase [Candidatus Bathyarchaeota archaeon]
MDLIQIIILATIQGITEWLPISSSGHLVVAQEYFGLAPSVTFDVMLHVGTLLVILIAFWRDIVKILKAAARLNFEAEDGKLAVFIVVGNIPTALIGFVFRDIFKSLFDNLLAVGTALLVTGCFVYVSKYGKNSKEMNYSNAFLIGITQGIAIIPGVSRSGITIATGLLCKLRRETAFKFSFLLSVPAVIGAVIAESENLFLVETDGVTMILGVVVSVIIGYVVLRLLRRLLLKERFHLFAYYCWLLGTAIVALMTMS